MSFAAAAQALGDRSQGVPQIEAYRDAIRAWKRVAGPPKPPAAIKHASE